MKTEHCYPSLDAVEIWKFKRNQAAKNTVKIAESAVRRYDKNIKLTDLGHERERSRALRAIFSRDKETSEKKQILLL